ncbi:hypothetical protein [Natronomonas gomsonensis]|uniref:DUF7562 family protein n=1 Tax=Natronomonas gomsonensis TaxID=1046043 RepID=UPI0015B99708|nr:hypothetical protein [Natronomonas gomsonensis]
MWRRRDNEEVTCIACGESVPRTEAREYDKHGDRWDREDKAFEHLCKPCYRELCHLPRSGLETLLEDIDTGGRTREEFLAEYVKLVESDHEAESRD